MLLQLDPPRLAGRKPNPHSWDRPEHPHPRPLHLLALTSTLYLTNARWLTPATHTIMFFAPKKEMREERDGFLHPTTP